MVLVGRGRSTMGARVESVERRWPPPLHGVDMEENSMPVTIKLSYRSYEARLREGRLPLEDVPCPR